MKGKYDDIINLYHFEPQKHPRMSIEARSAQFAPFSALTGYEDVLKETGRITDFKRELNEDEKEILDGKLSEIINRLNNKECVSITIIYFKEDLKKEGGEYIELSGNVKRIDKYNQEILFEDGTNILIQDINNIEF